MSFVLVTLRVYHGGYVDFETNSYVGNKVTDVFDFDIDRLSFFELRDYVAEFGYNKGAQVIYIKSPANGSLVEIKSDKDISGILTWIVNGDILEVFVAHLIEQPVAPLPIEYPSQGVGDSGVSFENETSQNVGATEGSSFNEPEEFEPPTCETETEAPNEPTPQPDPTAESSDFSLGSADFSSSEDSLDNDDLFEEVNADYGSDVHEEYRELREVRRAAVRKKNKAKAADLDFILGKKGVDVGYDETEPGYKKSLDGKLGGDEPFYPSDEAASYETDSDQADDESEGPKKKRCKRKNRPRVIFDPASKKIVWETGLAFQNVYQFREALTLYAITEKVQLDKYINEKKKVRVRCKKPKCPWLLYASFDSRTGDFVVKNYNPVHRCVCTNKNKFCNSKFIAKQYKKQIIQQPTIRIVDLQKMIREDLEMQVGRTVIGRARYRVLKELMGDHEVEFGRILDYKDELLRSNPGSTCVVKLSEDTYEDGKKMFNSFYICFAALKKAFLTGCRKCIGLDGCFLKGICKGQLLTAVCKDGNNQMLPVAWAVVEYENQHTWRWFVNILRIDLELGDGIDVTIITDMQKGLKMAIDDLLPNSEHRMCARHILANWSKNWRGIERRNTFWKIARSTFETELRENIEYMKKLGEEKMMDDLLYYNVERWSKVYFNYTSKCDSVDNNMAESFNSWILEARHKTIITMLEEIRVKMMIRIRQMREFCSKWPLAISPMAQKTIKDNMKKSMKCTPVWNGDTGFEVKEEDCTHNVDMENMTCSCRSWGLKGIPCQHAIAALHDRELDPMDYVSHWYSRNTYMDTYGSFIQPVLGMKMWPQSQNPLVIPPEVRRMPGRPKKVRRKEATETKRGKLSKRGVDMTCSNCHQKGHNKRGCHVAPPPSRPAGRSSVGSAAAPPSSAASSAAPPPSTASSSAAPPPSTGRGRGIPPGPASQGVGVGRGRGTTSFKRPRMVGMGVLHTDSGFTIHNPGMSTRHGKRSADVTGDIGYKPKKGLKWKGNAAVSTSGLQQMKAKKMKETKANAAERVVQSQTSTCRK